MAENIVAPSSEFWAKNAATLIKRLDGILAKRTSRNSDLRFTTPILPDGKLVPGQFGFDDLDIVEVARQMTAYEHSLYRKVRSPELLKNAWNGPDKHVRAPNLTSLIEFFNNVSHWIIYEIVSRPLLT